MADDLLKQQIGGRLKLVREALGFGVREFGRELDIDHTKWHQHEKGKTFPSVPLVIELWRRYHVTADFIFLGEIAGMPSKMADSLRAAEAASAAKKKVPANRVAEKSA